MNVISTQPPGMEAFLQEVVCLANETAKGLTGKFSEVRTLVDGGEVVLAVWQDFNEPTGVGTLLIKGQQRLREMMGKMGDGDVFRPKLAAIPCTSFEQAEALRQVAGEQDRRH